MAEITSLAALAKTSVDSNDYLVVANSVNKQAKKLAVESLFPSVVTPGAGSLAIFNTITSKNQLNLRGVKSNNGILTIALNANNIEYTVNESAINLNNCSNAVSLFLKTINNSNWSGTELSVANGGTGATTLTDHGILLGSGVSALTAMAVLAKGSLLVGQTGADPIALTAGTNGQVLTADSAQAAGVKWASNSISVLATDLDASTFDINLNAAAGTSWITGDGSAEGLTVDTTGKVIIGDNTPTPSTAAGQLHFMGSTVDAIVMGNANSYRGHNIKQAAAPAGVDGGDVEFASGAAGSGNQAGGDLIVRGGASTGTGLAGDVTIAGGDDASGTGTSGEIKLVTYSSSVVQTLMTLEKDYVKTYMPQVHAGAPQKLNVAGAVSLTTHITHISSAGAIALTLANGIEGQEKVITMLIDGGDATLTPASFGSLTNITFNDTADTVSLLYTSSRWIITGYYGVTIA